MTCDKVVYHIPNNITISAYCNLQIGHDGPCKYVPYEYLIQICKKILIERGEVVLPTTRVMGVRCSSINSGVQCGSAAGHPGSHSSGRQGDPVRWE